VSRFGDTGGQDARVERLHQVGVGPRLQAGDLVGRLGPRREQDDRDGVGHRVGLEGAAEAEAVELRHHDVGYDQVGKRLASQLEAGLAVSGFQNVVLRRQDRADVGPHIRIVVHQQYRGAVFGILFLRQRALRIRSLEREADHRATRTDPLRALRSEELLAAGLAAGGCGRAR